jgi:hypothetical protein
LSSDAADERGAHDEEPDRKHQQSESGDAIIDVSSIDAYGRYTIITI